MRRFVTRIASLIVGLVCCTSMAGAQPPNCIPAYHCLFNQEAATPDAAGIHAYSADTRTVQI